jgi:hypothetical protein
MPTFQLLRTFQKIEQILNFLNNLGSSRARIQALDTEIIAEKDFERRITQALDTQIIAEKDFERRITKCQTCGFPENRGISLVPDTTT